MLTNAAHVVCQYSSGGYYLVLSEELVSYLTRIFGDYHAGINTLTILEEEIGPDWGYDYANRPIQKGYRSRLIGEYDLHEYQLLVSALNGMAPTVEYSTNSNYSVEI